MAIKKDLSVDYLGVKCENPFFLSSSPVGGNYDMVAKAYKEGWGGVFFKTVGIFVADECSPRFDITRKEVVHRRAIDYLDGGACVRMREIQLGSLILEQHIDNLLKD